MPSIPNMPDVAGGRLPLVPLFALALASFITILTEALPAGLLSQMSVSLGVSEALVGQSITIYALGSLLAAIPLTTATRSWRRRPLLVVAIAGFALANTVTALTGSYVVLLGARFLAGVAAGLVWSLLAGYAARMVRPDLQGRAIAVAMLGTPLALALGVPAGTALGVLFSWRVAFSGMSGLAVLLIFWIWVKVPDQSGIGGQSSAPLRQVFATPGLLKVLFMTLSFVLAHNILYTYLAPSLHMVGLGNRTDAVLLAFGIASTVGIWCVGAGVDRWLRGLILLSFLIFLLAATGLAARNADPVITITCVLFWGLSFGGSATLFQTASARIAGEHTDLAQSMIVTVWNIAIAGGGILGGVLLGQWGAAMLPWAVISVLIPGFAVSVFAGKHLPPRRRIG